MAALLQLNSSRATIRDCAKTILCRILCELPCNNHFNKTYLETPITKESIKTPSRIIESDKHYIEW